MVCSNNNHKRALPQSRLVQHVRRTYDAAITKLHRGGDIDALTTVQMLRFCADFSVSVRCFWGL